MRSPRHPHPSPSLLMPIMTSATDEFIFTCTHTRPMPWFLPGVPPTNKKLAVPFVGVVNVRGDRLYHVSLAIPHSLWQQTLI